MLGRIASIFVDIKAPRAGLDSDLRSAEAAVQQSAQKMNATTGAAAASGGFAAGLKEATKPARDIMAALIGTVGIITRALGLIGLVTAAAAGVASIIDRIANGSERAAAATKENAASWASFMASMRAGRANLTTNEVDSLKFQIRELNATRAGIIADSQKKALGTDRLVDLQRQIQDMGVVLQQAIDLGMGDDVIERRRGKLKKLTDEANNLLAAAAAQSTAELDSRIEEMQFKLKNASKKAAEESAKDWKEAFEDVSEEDVLPIFENITSNDSLTRFLAFLSKITEASDKYRRDMEAGDRAVQRSAASIQAIFSQGSGPESYALQRIGQALMDVQSQLSTIALASQRAELGEPFGGRF